MILAHLQTIDIGLLAAQVVGIGAGGYLGYRARLWQIRAGGGEPQVRLANQGPLQNALFLGLAIFAGCTVVEDLFGVFTASRETYGVTKYTLAVGSALFQYALLRRAPAVQGAVAGASE